jgi:hypothetical protein
MDAAVGEQAPEMERAVARLEIGEEFDQRRIRRQRAVGDRLVDPGQFLVNDPARAEVQVADFAVAHLPGGQADVLARGAEPALRVGFIEILVERAVSPAAAHCLPASRRPRLWG